MRVALFSSGFTAAQLRLQPWLTLGEVGRRLQAAGHEVCVATDAADAADLPLPARRFSSLAGTASRAIADWLRDFAPDRAVVSVSPFSLATAGWHGALRRDASWAFLPYALYEHGEMAAAWPHLIRADRWGFGRNLLVPGPVWRSRLRRRFRGVICQSRRTARRLGDSVTTNVIPPGIELANWTPADAPDAGERPRERPFVYVGSPKAIRGFDVMLDAFALLPDGPRLRVLARGASVGDEAALRSRLAARGLADRVEVRGGWLDAAGLAREIRDATAVLLPFVLVPSELPVSVMEVVACGTPVITTDIDGLPEAVGAAGRVVPPGDAPALAKAIRELAELPAHATTLRRACLARRRRYHDWSEVAGMWTRLLEED